MMDIKQIARARQALNDMDDFARMSCGVDAFGPRKALEEFISSVEAVVSPNAKLNKHGHEAHCNLMFPFTIDSADDHCDCVAATIKIAEDGKKIKTWQERTGNHRVRPGSTKHMIEEIAELRSALAAATSQPVNVWNAWKASAANECALRLALEDFLKMYVGNVNSGDWGHWNPEEDEEVIAARAALAGKAGV
jgi:hypothetical protein